MIIKNKTEKKKKELMRLVSSCYQSGFETLKGHRHVFVIKYQTRIN